MEIPDYEPFYLQSSDALRSEIERLGLKIPLDEKLSPLARPLSLGGVVFPNRFCAQPITGGDALADGSPGELTWRRYVDYAKGRFGLVWFERTAALVPEKSGQLALAPANVSRFAALVSEMKSAAETPPVVILQLTTDQPDHLLTAAMLAREAGFDGLDIQGAPEALPDYLSLVRTGVPDLLLATRLCAYEAVRNGFGVSCSDFRTYDTTNPFQILERMQRAGLQLLNVTSSSPVLMGPERGLRSRTDHERPDEHPLMTVSRQLSLAHDFRNHFTALPVVGSGMSWLRQFLPQVAAGAVASGWMDFAGLGRPALACPDLPSRVLAGRDSDSGATCMVCFACSQLERANRSVGCVLHRPEQYGPIFRDMRRLDEDRLQEGAARCHLCESPPCRAKSPTGTDIPSFIKAFREGREQDAYRIVRTGSPLPRLVSETSPFWLEEEGSCIETTLTGVPVPIRDLRYAVAWRAAERNETGIRIPADSSGHTVAVVGGGPAGIAASTRLIELGHHVQLHETSETLGGVASRLLTKSRLLSNPADEIWTLLQPALDSRRLKIVFGSTLGKTVFLPALLDQHSSVLLSVGLWKERSLGAALGVVGGLDFLEHWRGPVPDRVAVLAGGDSAMDVCVALRARGALEIYVIFGGPRHLLHWHMSESWFATPGVHAMMHWQPLGYETDGSGILKGVHLQSSEFNLEMLLPVNLVVEAMGLKPHENLVPEEAFGTGRLFTAGAMVNGGASIGQCLADGHAIAETIHRGLAR